MDDGNGQTQQPNLGNSQMGNIPANQSFNAESARDYGNKRDKNDETSMMGGRTKTPMGNPQEPHNGREISKSETDLAVILRRRLEGIDHELSDFNVILRDFSSRVDE